MKQGSDFKLLSKILVYSYLLKIRVENYSCLIKKKTITTSLTFISLLNIKKQQ